MFDTVEASQLATLLAAAQVSDTFDDLRPPARPAAEAAVEAEAEAAAAVEVVEEGGGRHRLRRSSRIMDEGGAAEAGGFSASSCHSTAGAGAGAAGRRDEGWETQEGGQAPSEEGGRLEAVTTEEGGRLEAEAEAEAEAEEAPSEAAEDGSGPEPLPWQVRLQSAVSAAVETRAGEPLALIAHLLRHAPPSSEDSSSSAAEYAARHGLPSALEAAVRGYP